MNRKQFDPLMHSLSIINAYRALSSEAYISLTSQDPILTAFLLTKELFQLSHTEKEFKVRPGVHQDADKIRKGCGSKLCHFGILSA